jgi:hypothetical protein
MRLERGLRTLEEDEWTLEEDEWTLEEGEWDREADEWTLEENGVTSVEEGGVTCVEEDGVTCAEEYVESMNEPLRFMLGCPGIDWSLLILSCSWWAIIKCFLFCSSSLSCIWQICSA